MNTEHNDTMPTPPHVRRLIAELNAAGYEVRPIASSPPADPARVLTDPNGGCSCEPFDQDAGGGHTERLLEYEPDCPEHSTHLYDPRAGEWILDPRGTVTTSVDEWRAQMDAERARQIEHGYDDAHDAKHGVAHLLNWAIDYARRGNNLAAATMVRCALRLPYGTVTDTEVVWEYQPGHAWTDRDGEQRWFVQSGVIAPGYVAEYISEGGEVLRRKVGPWETVTADTVTEARS